MGLGARGIFEVCSIFAVCSILIHKGWCYGWTDWITNMIYATSRLFLGNMILIKEIIFVGCRFHPSIWNIASILSSNTQSDVANEKCLLSSNFKLCCCFRVYLHDKDERWRWINVEKTSVFPQEWFNVVRMFDVSHRFILPKCWIVMRHLDLKSLQCRERLELVKWPLSSFKARQRNSSQKLPNVWIMRLTSHIIQLF